MGGYRSTRLDGRHLAAIEAAAPLVMTVRGTSDSSTYEMLKVELYLSQAGTITIETSTDEGVTYFVVDSKTWLASDYYVHEIWDPTEWTKITIDPDVDTNASGYAKVSGVERCG